MFYYLLYPFFYLIGILPKGGKRTLARFIHWIVYKVIGYRVGVVRDNLERSFPEKTTQERLDIERKFYVHLADVILETVDMTTVSPEKLKERIEFINADQIEQYTNGRSWISVMAHYGSWEYTTTWGMYSSHDHVLAVYRPLRSKTMDTIFRRARSRCGVEPVPMDNAVRDMIIQKRKGQTVTLALIADQNPPNYSGDHWFEFLGRETIFFMGAEKLALRFSMPVAFLHMDKFDNGQYKAWFEIIYDGEEKVEPGEITARYINRLESMIRSRPELWMWSHKRWKHKKTVKDNT